MEKIRSSGNTLRSVIMPCIPVFIAWGLFSALFMENGWIYNEKLANLIDPFGKYGLPMIISYQAGYQTGKSKGGYAAFITSIGLIGGTQHSALMPSLIGGLFIGWLFQKWNDWMSMRIKPGFEMLVQNFSIACLGLIGAIIGFYTVEPIVGSLLNLLMQGATWMANHQYLPLLSIVVEPAKIFFLNNIINHGILLPIGIEQAKEAGSSIFFMIETNPAPGAGVLLAYQLFSKSEDTRHEAFSAFIIHTFGGIHEISFPYILMNPLLLVATIAGNFSSTLFFSLTHTTLVGPVSPGSIFGYFAMAYRSQYLYVLVGLLIGFSISFLISLPILRKAPEKKEKKEIDWTKTNCIYFACDSGMGSSAMGASVLKKKLKANDCLNIEVTHCSVDDLPQEAQVVVCHENLAKRVRQNVPKAHVIGISNFITAPEYNDLVQKLKGGCS